MTSLKRSQTERPVATERASIVGADGTPKVHTDDFYMRRFRSQKFLLLPIKTVLFLLIVLISPPL